MFEARDIIETLQENGDVVYSRPFCVRVDERVVLTRPGLLESLGYRFVKYPEEGWTQYWARPSCIWALLRGWEKLRRSYWEILKFLYRRGIFHLRPGTRSQRFCWRNVVLGPGEKHV